MGTLFFSEKNQGLLGGIKDVYTCIGWILGDFVVAF